MSTTTKENPVKADGGGRRTDLANKGSRVVARIRRPWVLPAALAVVLCGLLTASGVLWFNDREGLADDPVAAARQEALNFFTLDYRNANADVDRVLSLATDPFETEYEESRGKLVKSLRAKRMVVTATVPENGTAIEFLSEDRAQVLVAVDTTTTVNGKGDDRQHHRARIELTEVDGTWLVSGFFQVG